MRYKVAQPALEGEDKLLARLVGVVSTVFRRIVGDETLTPFILAPASDDSRVEVVRNIAEQLDEEWLIFAERAGKRGIPVDPKEGEHTREAGE